MELRIKPTIYTPAVIGLMDRVAAAASYWHLAPEDVVDHSYFTKLVILDNEVRELLEDGTATQIAASVVVATAYARNWLEVIDEVDRNLRTYVREPSLNVIDADVLSVGHAMVGCRIPGVTMYRALEDYIIGCMARLGAHDQGQLFPGWMAEVSITEQPGMTAFSAEHAAASVQRVAYQLEHRGDIAKNDVESFLAAVRERSETSAYEFQPVGKQDQETGR